MLKVLHLANKESDRLIAANCATCQYISDFCQQNCPVRSSTEVNAGRSRMSSTGSTW